MMPFSSSKVRGEMTSKKPYITKWRPLLMLKACLEVIVWAANGPF